VNVLHLHVKIQSLQNLRKHITKLQMLGLAASNSGCPHISL